MPFDVDIQQLRNVAAWAVHHQSYGGIHDSKSILKGNADRRITEAAAGDLGKSTPDTNQDCDCPVCSEDKRLQLLAKRPKRPKIVCLCGSTRFWKVFQEQNLRLTKQGIIVLSIGAATASDTEHIAQGVITAEEKEAFDKLHFAKIELADEVLVLNVGGYIGNSTANEIAHAKLLGKPIVYLETCG